MVALKQSANMFSTEMRSLIIPKGVSDYEEGNVLLLGVVKDLIAVGFDHFTIGEGNWTLIIFFLFLSAAFVDTLP